MEFPFNLNTVFKDDVTKFDAHSLKQISCPGIRSQKGHLQDAIDQMGVASANAQGLRTTVTSFDRMRHSNHILYIVKEAEANNNNGCAVGILKIGHKKLFVYDAKGIHHEFDPLCVLDFYVHESRQRKGYGRKLFDVMLKDQDIKPQHLAIDKPSHKFSSFLQKHYNLVATIPQVNNFVIFTGFFHGQQKKSARKNSTQGDLNKPASLGIDLKQQKEALHLVSPRNNIDPEIAELGIDGDSNLSSLNNRLNGLQQGVYSRHSLNPTSPLPNIGQSKQSSANSLYGRKVPSPLPLHNPSMYMDRRGGHLKIPAQPVPNLINKPVHSTTLDKETTGNQSQAVLQPNNRYMYNNGHHQHHAMTNSSPPKVTNGEASSEPPTQIGVHPPEAMNKPATDSKQNHDGDVLLPKNFTPYSNLKLPEPDPYSRRAVIPRATDTTFNVFGIVKTQPDVGYASHQRFQNTRPW